MQEKQQGGFRILTWWLPRRRWIRILWWWPGDWNHRPRSKAWRNGLKWRANGRRRVFWSPRNDQRDRAQLVEILWKNTKHHDTISRARAAGRPDGMTP